MAAPTSLAGPTREHFDWPFFDESHRALALRLDAYAASGALSGIDHSNTDRACRSLVRSLGEAGLLDAATGAGGERPVDSRAACLTRETLAWHDGLADFAFAMQGLGIGAIGLSGSEALRRMVLPKAQTGEWIAAFALSE
ncbi:MAG TPA: acyl-CoA dehydrogenase family protein, partial [Pseudorhizobium sp.]|nr:acyl-CoA dehydrogenase family protein [Pseudorhizobium sp.]